MRLLTRLGGWQNRSRRRGSRIGVAWDSVRGTLINLTGEKIKFGREGEADLLFEGGLLFEP